MIESQRADYPLVLRLFGPFAAHVGGQPLPPLRSRKGHWLLALLALSDEKPLNRDWICGQLWPDAPASHALYSLRRSLSDLRGALGSEAWRVESAAQHSLRLCLRDAYVDALALQDAVGSGDSAALRAAFVEYRGPLLQDCPDEWCVAIRERFASMLVGAAESLSRTEMDRARPAEAARCLAIAAREEPYSERIHILWMQALAAAGDFAGATRVWRELRLRLRDELNCEPSHETAEAYQAIKAAASLDTVTGATLRGAALQRLDRAVVTAHRSSINGDTRPSNLPSPITRFIGRAAELVALRERHARERLVTLSGAGGVGKTRLAVQFAHLLSDEGDTVAFVALAPLADAAHVTSAVSSAIGVREIAAASVEVALVKSLEDRPLTLILDNCEHLLPGCAELAEMFLTRCPRLRVIATSRQPLGIAGEAVLFLEPLSLPEHSADEPGKEEPAAFLESDAVHLFLDRARAACGGVRLSSDAMREVAHICQRLDGLPLAIELAAAQLRCFTLEQLAERLEDRFEVLSVAGNSGVARHRTLRAALDWSYQLLQPDERGLFARLSVFAGGWTAEAAASISDLPPQCTLNLLGGLVDRSLVVLSPGGQAEPRYRFLAPIREYARARLAELEPTIHAGALHRAYFLRVVEGLSAALGGPEQLHALARLDAERNNLRAALDSYLADERGVEEALRMAAALWNYWRRRAYYGEAERYLAAAIAKCGLAQQTRAKAQVLAAAGTLQTTRGEYARACASFGDSLATCEALADEAGVAAALFGLGNVAHHVGDVPEARRLFDRAIQYARSARVDGTLATLLACSGDLACDLSDYTLARREYAECLAIQERLGDRSGVSRALTGLGRLAYERCDLAEAAAHLRAALGICREMGDRFHVAYLLGSLGGVALFQGDSAAALARFEESLAMREDLGDRLGAMIMLTYLGRAAADLGDVAKAERTLQQALDRLREAPDHRYRSEWLRAAAELEVAKTQGSPQADVRRAAATAAVLIGRADAQPLAAAKDLSPVERRRYDALEARIRDAIGDDDFAAAVVRGRGLEFDEAAELARAAWCAGPTAVRG